MHCDLEVEEYPATGLEAVLNTLLSSIPNIQGFPNMLGSPSSQQPFSQIYLSPIMGAATRIPTISFDSPIHTSPLPLSPPHPITTYPISQPPQVNTYSTSMNLAHKEVLTTYDSFTSLTFTSSSAPMNIPPLSIQIPLK